MRVKSRRTGVEPVRSGGREGWRRRPSPASRSDRGGTRVAHLRAAPQAPAGTQGGLSGSLERRPPLPLSLGAAPRRVHRLRPALRCRATMAPTAFGCVAPPPPPLAASHHIARAAAAAGGGVPAACSLRVWLPAPAGTTAREAGSRVGRQQETSTAWVQLGPQPTARPQLARLPAPLRCRLPLPAPPMHACRPQAVSPGACKHTIAPLPPLTPLTPPYVVPALASLCSLPAA